MAETYLNKPRYKYTDELTGNSFVSPSKLSPEQVESQVMGMRDSNIDMSDPRQTVKYGETPDEVLKATARILVKEDKDRYGEFLGMIDNLTDENRKTLEDEYFEQMRTYEWSVGKAVGLVANLRGTKYDQKDREALNLMFNNWEQTVPFYEGDLKEWGAFAGDVGEAMLKDPANYIFMGAPAIGASLLKNTVGKSTQKALLKQALKDSLDSGASQKAAEELIKGKIKKQVLKETGMSAAKWGAIEGSLLGGVHDVSLQEAKEQIGIGEGATVASALKSMAIGGTLGGVLGGAIGLAGGAAKARKTDLIDAKLEQVKGVPVDPDTLPKQPITAKKSKPLTQKQRDELYAARKEMDAKQSKTQQSQERRAIYDEFRAAATQIASQGKRTFGELPVGKKPDAQVEAEVMEFVQNNSKKVKDKNGRVVGYETDLPKLIESVPKISSSENSISVSISKVAMKMQGKKFEEAKAALRRLDSKQSPEAYKAAQKLLKEEGELWEKSTAAFDLLKGETGRGLRLVGKDFENLPDTIGVDNALDAYDTALGYTNVSQDLAGASSYINTVKRMSKELGESRIKMGYKKTRAFVNDIFVHNLMNAISTPVVNTVSSYGRFILSNIEDMLGGLVSGNLTVAGEGKLRMFKQWQYMGLALKHARNTFLTSDQTFSSRSIVDTLEGTDQQLTRDLNFSEGFMSGMQGATITEVGMNLNRFLSKRVMITTDDFNKTVSFNTKAYELIARQLAENGDFKNIKPADFHRRVEELVVEANETMIKAKAEGKPLPDTSIEKQALDYAEEMAFQSDPQKDIFGLGARGANWLRQNAPLFTQIMPFVRTPANLLSYVGDRTPVLQLASKTLRDKLSSPDPRIRAKAEGAMAIGSIIWASVFMKAASGDITGKPPTDKSQRETLMADEDYLPYSIDGVSIRRFDPLARFAMTAGVIHDTLVYQGEKAQTQLYVELAAGTAASLTEMPMLEGLQTVAGFLDFGAGRIPSAERLQKSTQAHLSSYMPFVRLFEEIYGTQERARYLPQNIGVFDFYKGRPNLLNLARPAYGEIDLKRDWNGDLALASTGENLSHLGITKKPQVNDDVKDEINDEFTRLQLGISPFPKSNNAKSAAYGLFGIDLSKYKTKKGRSYHDVAQEKTGTIKDSRGRTLKDTLSQTINSIEYLLAPDTRFGQRKGKDDILKEIVLLYRKLAIQNVIDELESLDNETGDMFKNELEYNKSQLGSTPVDPLNILN